MGLFSGWTHHWRRSPKLGWFRINFVGSGFTGRLSSITFEPWDWFKANSRTRRVSIDTPGPGGISKRFSRARRNRRSR